MAPRFKKNMFWCWSKEGVTKGLIGFADKNIKSIFRFRDELAASVSRSKAVILNKQEGEPTEADSVFRFYREEDNKHARELFNKPAPGFFATVFKTQKYKDWINTRDLISKLTKVDMETSHDFPCLIINSTVHSSKELSQEIKKIANELSIKLVESRELEEIKNPILTNRTFDVKTEI